MASRLQTANRTVYTEVYEPLYRLVYGNPSSSCRSRTPAKRSRAHATTGGSRGSDPPPKKKIGRTTPTFYVAADCSARNWVYHPHFVLYNNLDQGIGPQL